MLTIVSKEGTVVSEGDPSSISVAIEALSRGDFIVAPTDTIYGILARALDYETVVKLRRLRRPSGRPFIVLVPDVFWIKKLGLEVSKPEIKLLSTPGLTLVLSRRSGLYHWLGRETVAVRFPRRGFVHRLLKAFGMPLVAPSANPEGKVPAKSVREAFEYFGDKVSLYVDGGILKGKPSTLVRCKKEKLEVLREGTLSVDSLKRIVKRVYR